jgi:hypothetical protein
MPKKKKKTDKAKVHEHLAGFDIKIDPFGELQSNFNVDKINEFLNENLEDPKFSEEE